MHHSLKLYGGNRPGFLRVYMFFARWTKVPLVGRLVRWTANVYGRSLHRAFLLTPAEAAELVALAEGVALTTCDCRKVYHVCDNPLETEILLGPTRHIMEEAMPQGAREISREAALDVLRENHRRGLVFTILKCRHDFYAICSCCTCCCVPLRLSRLYGIGGAVTRHKDIVREFRDYQAACLAAPGS
jgi:hypothetical protein